MKITLLIHMFCAVFAMEASAGDAYRDFKPPFYVFDDYQSPKNHGAPSGWMGDFRDLIMDANCRENPHHGTTCIKITYLAKGSKCANWAGVMWQFPPNNWGEYDAGLNLTGAKKLTFWARGEEGGEVIDAFRFGGIGGAYPDSSTDGISNITLNPEWTKYEIDLSGVDLHYMTGLFCWVACRAANPDGFVIYLDDIRYE